MPGKLWKYILPDEIENRKADVHKQALDYKSGGIVTVEWGFMLEL